MNPDWQRVNDRAHAIVTAPRRIVRRAACDVLYAHLNAGDDVTDLQAALGCRDCSEDCKGRVL